VFEAMNINPESSARALEAALHAYKRGLLNDESVKRFAQSLRAELTDEAPCSALELLAELGPRECLRLPHDRFSFGRGFDERAELCLHASMIEAGAEHALEDLVDWLAGTKFGDRELDDVSGRCRRLLEAGRQVSARGLASGLLARITPSTRWASHRLARCGLAAGAA
jgi:hypothetical protein